MIAQTTFGIGLVLLVLFVVERFAALRRSSRPLLGRLFVNVGMSVLAFAVAMGVGAPYRARGVAVGGAAHARHPLLSGARRNELELLRGLLMVGQAAPDPSA